MLRPKAHKGGEGTFLRVMGPVSAILILNKFKVSMVPSFLPVPLKKKKKKIFQASLFVLELDLVLSFCKLLFLLKYNCVYICNIIREFYVKINMFV